MTLTYETRHTGERVAVLRGAWVPDIRDQLLAEGVKGLVLNYARGYDGGEDLDFVSDVPFLETLDVIDWGIRDISGIEALADLKRVSLSTHAKRAPSFELLANLEECSMTWIRGAESVFERESLVTLRLYGFPDSDFGRLGRLVRLRRFRTGNTPRLSSCDGIGALSSLEVLVLSYLPQLRSWDAIGALRNLRELEIVTCGHLDSLEFVRDCHALETLIFGNCKAIDSLAPLQALSRLETVHFWESTSIVDGDLSVLLELPRLREARFMNRKHYTHTREQIAAAIA